MRTSRLACTVMAAGCLAVLGACGSGGAKKLSATQLASRADAICAKARASARGIPAPQNLADPKQTGPYLEQVVPISEQETEDLAALRPDAAAKVRWDAFVTRQRAVSTLGKALRDKHSALTAPDLGRLSTAGAAVGDAARAIGATGCAGNR